jgi:alpha-galactosidase
MARSPLFILLAWGIVRVRAIDTPVPFYGSTASGKTSAPRGWNSFVAQSNNVELKVAMADEQCSFFYSANTDPDFDYVCSLDSGWSVDYNGDEHGRIIPKPEVFDTMSIEQFADELHQNGMKLGVYMLPGAFEGDADKTVEGLEGVTIGSLFNTTEDPRDLISNKYNARNDFDYTNPNVQAWHDSVVRLFDSW